MYKAITVIDRISFLFGLIAVALFAGLVIDMMYEVIARRLFDSPTLWANDIAYMSNGALFLLAAGYTLFHNEHIRIDFLSSRLPMKQQDIANCLAYALILWFLVNACEGTLVEFTEAFESGELEPTSPWAPVIWPFYLGISAAALLLVWQAVTLQINDSRSCLAKFKLNFWVGGVLFAGIVAARAMG